MKNNLEMTRKKVLLLNSYSDEYSDIKKGHNTKEGHLFEGHLFVETPLGVTYVYTYAKKYLPEVDFFIIDAQAMLIENLEKGVDKDYAALIKKESNNAKK